MCWISWIEIQLDKIYRDNLYIVENIILVCLTNKDLLILIYQFSVSYILTCCFYTIPESFRCFNKTSFLKTQFPIRAAFSYKIHVWIRASRPFVLLSFGVFHQMRARYKIPEL